MHANIAAWYFNLQQQMLVFCLNVIVLVCMPIATYQFRIFRSFDSVLFSNQWLFLTQQVLSKLQRRGVKRIIFSGDSLMREIYHMVVQLLSDEFEVGVPCAELPGEHQLLTRNGVCTGRSEAGVTRRNMVLVQ